MLLTLLLDPDFSRLGPIVLAGWGLLLGLVVLFFWAINQLSKGEYGRARGFIGLAVLVLLLLVGWKWIGLAVGLTLL